jgi:hypothetical protein
MPIGAFNGSAVSLGGSTDRLVLALEAASGSIRFSV